MEGAQCWSSPIRFCLQAGSAASQRDSPDDRGFGWRGQILIRERPGAAARSKLEVTEIVNSCCGWDDSDHGRQTFAAVDRYYQYPIKRPAVPVNWFKNLRQPDRKNLCFREHRAWQRQHISNLGWNRTHSKSPTHRGGHLVEFASKHLRL
jgi:hypothetical protein